MQLKLNEHPPNSQICVSNNWFYENHLRLNHHDMHRVTSYTIGMFHVLMCCLYSLSVINGICHMQLANFYTINETFRFDNVEFIRVKAFFVSVCLY